jgi:erythrocyte band 7 integral membrane protein
MCERESISLQAQEVLDEGTDPWGIKVERVEVKDIRLPRELTRVLAAEAEASRGADARVVSAAGELNVSQTFCLKRTYAFQASHALNEAANHFGESKVAIQLRYLQTLSRISTTQNHTIIIPIPMELVKRVIHRLKKS